MRIGAGDWLCLRVVRQLFERELASAGLQERAELLAGSLLTNRVIEGSQKRAVPVKTGLVASTDSTPSARRGSEELRGPLRAGLGDQNCVAFAVGGLLW